MGTVASPFQLGPNYFFSFSLSRFLSIPKTAVIGGINERFQTFSKYRWETIFGLPVELVTAVRKRAQNSTQQEGKLTKRDGTKTASKITAWRT